MVNRGRMTLEESGDRFPQEGLLCFPRVSPNTTTVRNHTLLVYQKNLWGVGGSKGFGDFLGFVTDVGKGEALLAGKGGHGIQAIGGGSGFGVGIDADEGKAAG